MITGGPFFVDQQTSIIITSPPPVSSMKTVLYTIQHDQAATDTKQDITDSTLQSPPPAVTAKEECKVDKHTPNHYQESHQEDNQLIIRQLVYTA